MYTHRYIYLCFSTYILYVCIFHVHTHTHTHTHTHMQVYLPERDTGTYPQILDSTEPMVKQPSRAQVLNLKRRDVELHVTSRELSKQMLEYPRQFANYQQCNASVAALLAPGQSTACAALVKLLFPSSKVTNPSGLTSEKLAEAPNNECYEPMLLRLRKAADICSALWQGCDEGCVEREPDCGGLGYQAQTPQGATRMVPRVSATVSLVRELLRKLVHLADAIFYLTTAAYGSKRGQRCGLTFPELVAKIPQLGACQVQEYMQGGVSGCFKGMQQQVMNAPFTVSVSNNCSAACHKGLDALIDIYGCCAATDRNAKTEWWQRLQHSTFRTFLVEWQPSVTEIFSAPASSVEEDTCATSARAYIDCALPKCQHSAAGKDPAWQGWADYPQPCCRMQCPGGATKSFPNACTCICPAGFVGEFCNITMTHVLVEMQVSSLSVCLPVCLCLYVSVFGVTCVFLSVSVYVCLCV